MPRKPSVEPKAALQCDNARKKGLESSKDGPDFEGGLDLLARSKERMEEKINFQV
jgi:hypothetical protein